MDPGLISQQLYMVNFLPFCEVGIWLWKGPNGSRSYIKVGMEKEFKLSDP